VAVADASRVMAQVRLLATPERIRTELDPATDGLALELLRSLWRRAGGRFHLGIVADLEVGPPGLGGARGAADLLDALQARQLVVWRRVGEGLTVMDPARAIDAWKVDWTAHERRRAGELKKLDQMQRYAYTESCRRGFVLRYFGDPAARPTCTACDNCTGARRPASEAPPSRGGRGGNAGRAKKATRRRAR
jgi:ATP-dependent DNA helicase RecQ